MSDKKIEDVIILCSTSEYRGDHEADILVPVRYDPDETVAELVRRTLVERARRRFTSEGDHLQVRVILKEADE